MWSSVEEPNALPLPSFSGYPQSYVTSLGENLSTLEGISNSDTKADEAEFFATEWMFKVAEGAMEHLQGIKYITDHHGYRQLSADFKCLSECSCHAFNLNPSNFGHFPYMPSDPKRSVEGPRQVRLGKPA